MDPVAPTAHVRRLPENEYERRRRPLPEDYKHSIQPGSSRGMINREICVVTRTRAKYGFLFWLMKEIDSDLDLQLAVTGAHLSPEFGKTLTVIEDDGFSTFFNSGLKFLALWNFLISKDRLSKK
jgi:hypothetical protein